MAIGELGKYHFHGRLPEYCGTGLDPETVAILLDSGQFAIIQIDNLTVTPTKRLPALLENVRIYCRDMLFLSCQDSMC